MVADMKKQINLKCSAKINLALDVIGKRTDGYHLLDSIFQTVSVYDKLEVTLTKTENISLTCNFPEIPCDEKNLAYRAAKAFLEKAKIHSGVNILLEKEYSPLKKFPPVQAWGEEVQMQQGYYLR